MYQCIEITDENIHHLPELIPVINMWMKILSIHKLKGVIIPEDIPIYLNLDYIDTNKPQYQWVLKNKVINHITDILSFNLIMTLSDRYMFLNGKNSGQEIVETYNIYDIIRKINRYIMKNSELGLERYMSGLSARRDYSEILNMTDDEFELLIRML